MNIFVQKISIIFFASVVSVIGFAPVVDAAGVGCYGRQFDPVNDPDWNDVYPITVAGATINGGGRSANPIMHEDAVCMCPGAFGTLPGVGMTFWQPSYLVEIQRTAGCLSSLSGVSTLGGYEKLNGNERGEGQGSEPSSVRRQVHWFAYPLFAVLNLFSGLGCKSFSGFELENMTEVDATWQDDTVAALLDPLVVLTATPLGMISCIPDVVTSGFGYPMDTLFWCGGYTGVVPPTSANTAIGTSPEVTNQHILYKYMMRSAREARLLTTIGPWAECNSMYLPVWVKSQYRFNVVSPLLIRTPRPIVVGQTEMLWSGMPPGHTPQDTSNTIVIWVGTQCCARL